MIEPLLTFKEYLERVVANASRADEFKILVDLFGLPYLDRTLAGLGVVDTQPFLKVRHG